MYCLLYLVSLIIQERGHVKNNEDPSEDPSEGIYEDIGDGGPGTDHSVWHSVLFSCPTKDNSSGEAKKKT